MKKFSQFLICLSLVLFQHAQGANTTVQMSGLQFVPRNVTVNVGDTVTWTNTERTTHDSVSGSAGTPDGTWNSNTQFGRLMRQGESFSFTFSAGGSYSYYCTPHWSLVDMTGNVTVQSPNSPPSVAITSPTGSESFTEPANVTINASASDSDGNITKVEFFVNGASIGTDNSSPYSAVASGLTAGNYTLRADATDDSGATRSSSVEITVGQAAPGEPPVISVQPQSQTVTPGSTATFSVSASGTPPLNYQWYFAGAPLVGKTSFNCILPEVTLADAGEYFVVIGNDFGSVTSSIATLTVSGDACSFALSTSNSTFTASGGTRTVAINTGSTCAWGVTNTNSWITFLTSEGIGTATIQYKVFTNTAATSRTGKVVIAGIPFTITQSGGKALNSTDLNNDGHDDLIWQDSNGRVAVWFMNGANSIGSKILRNGQGAGPGWNLVGFADFTKDGKTDFLWQYTDGRLALWVMNGTTFVRSMALASGPALGSAWKVAAVNDFNKDKNAELLFRHTSGFVLLRQMNGTSFVSQSLLLGGEPVPMTWTIAGAGDFSGDSQPDILWRRGDNSLVLWTMSGTTPNNGLPLSNLPKLANTTVLGAIGDLNSNGKSDLIWRDLNGRLNLWYMNGTNRTSSTMINGGRPVAAMWKLVGPR